MKTFHTPGPWITPSAGVWTADGKTMIASLGDKEVIRSRKQSNTIDNISADARLIAASPMLLEALKLLQEVAARTTQNIVAFDGASELDSAIDAARAAISAAEGN